MYPAKFASVIGLTLLLASPLSARDFIEWTDIGDWKILVDIDTGNGCYMQKDYEDGSRVELGVLPEREGAFVAVLNKDWSDLEAGTTGTLNFDIDGELFAGDADVIVDGDWYGGSAFFNNPEFVTDFGKKNSLTVSGDGGRSVTINLKGTSRAINEVKECQKAQNQ